MLTCFLHQQSGGGAALEEDHDLRVQLAQTLLLLVYIAAVAQ